MSYTNQTKNVSTFTNQSFGAAGLTWDESTFEWQNAGNATWDDPQAWANQSKDASTFTNGVKH